jgi:hypothetical protein
MTGKSGRVISWLTFVLGIAVSIAGNIGHAASDGMRPGEWLGAAFWPSALMLSVEILTRVRWQPQKRWWVARFAALVLVSVVAAVLSYLHLRSLMLFWGEHPFQATIGPLAVDGLMLMAATALLSISHEKAPEPIAVVEALPEPVAVPDSVDREIDDLLSTLEKPTRVETSKSVTLSDAEEAARQAWINAPADEKPSVRKLAGMTGLSPSKTHRLIGDWRKELEHAR